MSSCRGHTPQGSICRRWCGRRGSLRPPRPGSGRVRTDPRPRRAFVWFESSVYDNFRYMQPSEVSVYFVRLYFAFPALDSVRPVTAKQSAALAAERQASGSPPDAVKIDGHAAQLRLTG